MDIEIQGLNKMYLAFPALRDININIGKGEIVGLLGANGAGKSTLLHIIMGFTPYEEGFVKILGKSPAQIDVATREMIGFVPEETSLPPWATPLEIAGLHRCLFRKWDEDTFSHFVDAWHIFADKRIRALSKGQRRLTELALCLSSYPAIALLDEPFMGLDPAMRRKLLNAIIELNRDNSSTIFFSSHILSDVEKICNRVIIIREGEICLDELIDDLKYPLEETFMISYGLCSDD